ncbi:MAG TPA: hypothetical protein VN937_06900 [Blastocatellia bacterium]|nr:hypothetical protein [Blastocatellia bacterium]
MVKASLVERDVSQGKRFLQALNDRSELRFGSKKISLIPADRFRIKAAFWWYLPEASEWRLFIATPLVDEEGPLQAFRDINTVLASRLDLHSDISLQNISVLSPKDPIIKAINKAMKILPDREGARFTRSTLNGTFVEDAFVYRLP